MTNDKHHNAQLLSKAARLGNTAEVERLLALPMDKIRQGEILLASACSGRIECVKLLVKNTRPVDKDEALAEAAENGHLHCVQFLIPLCNPKYAKSLALRLAASRGHAKCVELLIPVSTPQVHNSEALRSAVEFGHTPCIDLLYPISNPITALQWMQKEFPHEYEIWGVLEQRIDAEKLHQTLTTEVAGSIQTQHTRKM